MSERSGTLVIKLNDELKGLIKDMDSIFTWDSLTHVFKALDFTPQIYEKPVTIEKIVLDVTAKKIVGNYAKLQVIGFDWDMVFNMFNNVPNLQYWATLYDSNEQEMFFAKTKKEIFTDTIVWDGELDPEPHKQIAELQWFSLMNKTIMKHFLSAELLDNKLAEVKEFKSNKKEADHWAEFYKTHFDDSLFLKLTIKNLEDRNYLLSNLNLFFDKDKNLTLDELRNKLNSRFAGEYIAPLDDENISIFEEIYSRISFVRNNQNNIFIGAVLDDSNKFIENPDDHSRGYSKGKSFIDFSRFFMQISNDFTGQIWCRKQQQAYRLTAFDGYIYMN